MQIGSSLKVFGIVALAAVTSAMTAWAVRPATAAVTQSQAKGSRQDPDTNSSIVVEREIVVREVAPQAVAPPTNAPAPLVAHSAPDPNSIKAQQLEWAEKAAAAFDTDGHPTADSQALETSIRNVLTDRNLVGVRVERVECRAKSCRLETTLTNSQADEQVFQQLTEKVVKKSDYSLLIPMRETNSDGSISETAYFFSPGAMPVLQTSG